MPLSTERFRRLARAVQPSFRALKPFREAATAIQNQYLGPHYGKVSLDARPINMTEMALTLHLNELSSANPQVLCLTHSQELKAAAREKELALNETLKRMDFSGEHRLWVMSALIGWGIIQVGLETTDRRMVDEEMLPTTNVFVETILLDDWVHDMTARKWGNNQVKFCGHRYSVPLEWAKNNPDFDKEVREQLTKRESPASDAMEHASGENSNNLEAFTDMVDLWSLWVPDERCVVTMASSEQGQSAQPKPLRCVNWTGPEHGPYHQLGFGPVLSNVIPLAPATNWFDADDLTNRLFLQLGIDASQAKTIGITSVAGKQDADRIIKSANGDTICVDQPGQYKTERFGGVDQIALAFAQQMKQLTSYVMGNLDSQAGLSQEGSTLGQEQIIKSSASGRMRSMQVIVAEATTKVIRDIAFYLHRTPLENMNLTLELPGKSKLPITWPMQLDENGIEFDSREGEHEDYLIDIVPYSMTNMTPGERAQVLTQIWQGDILPVVMSGMPPPQGFDEYLRLKAKYMSMPEISDIYQPSAQPPQQMPGNGGGGSGFRPPTNSTYTRENVSRGMTPQAFDQQQQMMLLGGGGNANQGSAA